MSTFGIDHDLWVRRFHPAPDSKAWLVCFPPAGGAATFYLPLSEGLQSTLDVCSIQYPGRQDRHREPCIDNIPELADAIFTVLAGCADDRPMALFGHSMGAILAYEVARRFESAGLPPVFLFASGRRAPSRWRDESVHRRSDDGVVAELQRLNGIKAQLLGDEEMMQLILNAVRSDYKAIETYAFQLGERLTCPITVLVGSSDPLTAIDEAQSWQDHTAGTFDIQVFSGGHHYIEEHLTAVVNVVSDALHPVLVPPVVGR
jgi:surfactin synthase thioesterase subunit